jgi:type 1 glutamine amidotransferase
MFRFFEPVAGGRVTQHALLVAGRGRYEDPWHDHAGTSHSMAMVLEDEGLSTTVRGLFPDAVDDLESFDLLIVNAGQGRQDPGFDGDDRAWVPVHERIKSYASHGGAILAVHQGINAFLDSPHWSGIVGGRWVRGKTWHPPIGQATFRVCRQAHPITHDLDDIEVHDERYTLLEPDSGVVVLTAQRESGVDHPTGWVNTADGNRVVYDSLGHDVTALKSRGRRALLLREVRWLLDDTAIHT